MTGLRISLEENSTPLHVDSTKIRLQMEGSLRGELLIRLVELNAASDGQIEGKKKGDF
ncbi:MAG: hypothetical protein P1U77_17155 [Rubripirellula sp.]|jgi:hypothetical protein|nr:hypothetical protein [Rubripirellula sp.]